MADVTVDEVRDVAQALNSKAAVIGLPLHFFTQDRDDVREAIAKRCTRLLREGVESLPRFELVMLLKEAGVCTDPLKPPSHCTFDCGVSFFSQKSLSAV